MNHLLLGAAAILAADMIGGMDFAKTSSPGTQKLIRLAAGGLAVWAGHKYLLKGA
jgi:hypothetical protein